MGRQFSENSRVQVPAAIHLLKLGYKYLSYIDFDDYDHDTNILTKEFKKQFMALNPEVDASAAKAKLAELLHACKNEDMGREFYQKISSTSAPIVIDYVHPERNSWLITTEFTCRNEEKLEEFRPDITVFVNGLPLAFIEVKIPNNREGIMAERNRAEVRMNKPAFNSFFIPTQLMLYSNNQEYDHEAITPIQGAFYATLSKGRCFFNTFREADKSLIYHCGYNPNGVTDSEIEEVLIHRNYHPRPDDAVFQTNMNPNTPTNRLITSLLSKERFLFLLRYGFAQLEYTEKKDADSEPIEHMEKHVMRYPQLFATLAIRRRLDEGKKGGIIWHTQGSGKTALAFYNLLSLRDYFAKKETAVKFYFIVDRLDLMEQATDEFTKRGITVFNAQDRQKLMDDINSTDLARTTTGKLDIMVVNIQKFKEDHQRVKIDNPYNTNLVRVFFIDEAHRGYRPEGSFLANLLEADTNGIHIALTGTPLLKSEIASWKVFGDYIDTYYYDKSIADGFTLKLMREDVAMEYKEQIADVIKRMAEGVKVRQSDINPDDILCAPNLLNPIIDYVEEDMRRFRIQNDDKSLAAMLVCKTNKQARRFNEMMLERVASGDPNALRPCLILHDEGDKATRASLIDDFKKRANIDILIVNAMLLTGFDAHRLKKLYLMRKLEGVSLLQALTRVNRPYSNMKYGYIVDFANIKENFIEINNQYLRELRKVDKGVRHEMKMSSGGAGESLLLTHEDVMQRIEAIKDAIWTLPIDNPEEFRQILDQETDRAALVSLRTSLEDARALYNEIRSFGDDEMKEKFNELDLVALPHLLHEVNNRLERIALLESTDRRDQVSKIVREAISLLKVNVRKKGEGELEIIYNQLAETMENVKNEFDRNIDKQAPDYIELSKAFQEFFKRNGFTPQNVAEAKEQINYMEEVMRKIRKINSLNFRLQRLYSDNDKFVRVHKRIAEENEKREHRTPPEPPLISKTEREIAEGLNEIRRNVERTIWLNNGVLDNRPYLEQSILQQVSLSLLNHKVIASVADRKWIRNTIANEYVQYTMAV